MLFQYTDHDIKTSPFNYQAVEGCTGKVRLIQIEQEKMKNRRLTRFSPKLRRFYSRFLKIRGTPEQIASGFALGVFIGFWPIVFQLPLAVFIASLFRWNKFTAGSGVMITNPLTAPFIYSATYLIGAKLTGVKAAFNLSVFSDLSALIDLVRQAPGIFAALALGGVLLGLPAAIIGYFVAFKAAEKYQRDLKAKIAQRKERLRKKLKNRKKHRKNRN